MKSASVSHWFSIPWAVATAVLKRKIFIEDFTEQALSDLETIRIAGKVILKQNPELESKTSILSPMVVEILLKNGLSYSERVEFPKGNPKNPVTVNETKDTFRRCAKYAAKSLSKENVEQVIQMMEELEHVDDMSKFTGLLCGS